MTGSRVTRKAPWVFLVTTGVLLLWTATTVVESFSPNALTDRSAVASAVRSAVVTVEPQGWAFFTASAEEPKLLAWRTRSLATAVQLPQTRPQNLFGISRAQRAQGPELALLGQHVPHWLDCFTPASPTSCLDRTRDSSAGSISNGARDKTLCGDIIIGEVKPTPFAFRSFGYADYRIVKTARIEVSCS